MEAVWSWNIRTWCDSDLESHDVKLMLLCIMMCGFEFWLIEYLDPQNKIFSSLQFRLGCLLIFKQVWDLADSVPWAHAQTAIKVATKRNKKRRVFPEPQVQAFFFYKGFKGLNKLHQFVLKGGFPGSRYTQFLDSFFTNKLGWTWLPAWTVGIMISR